jgi:thiol-disulfide isomerase/thioredoxin
MKSAVADARRALSIGAVSLLLVFSDFKTWNLKPKTASAADETAEQSARNAVVHRLQALQNLSVQYRMLETYTPMPGLKEKVEAANKPGQPQSHVRLDASNYDCVYRYNQGSSWYETTLIEDDLAALLPKFLTKHEIDAVADDGFERLDQAINRDQPIGNISPSPKSSMLRPRQLIDVALGVRVWDQHPWLKVDDFQQMEIEATADGIAEFRRPSESGKKMHAWRFDRQHGYALKTYTSTFIDSGLKELEVSCDNFVKQDELWLPRIIDVRRFGPGTPGDQRVLHESQMEVSEYQVNPATNTPESFHITWPLGSTVVHEKTGKNFSVRSAPQILSETKIAELLKNPPPPRAQEPPAPATQPVDHPSEFKFYTVAQYDDARNPADDLAKTIERAKSEKKNILIQVGGDWCGWCKLMSEFIETNERVRENISKNYLLMKVTYDQKQPNTAFLAQYPSIPGYPHLFVLDSDGKLLHSQGTAELEQGRGYNEQAYLEFLEKWKPER